MWPENLELGDLQELGHDKNNSVSGYIRRCLLAVFKIVTNCLITLHSMYS